MPTVPQHPSQRAKIVSYRGTVQSITTQVYRDQYDEFEKRSHAAGLTKAAMLRKLVEDYLRD